MPTIIDDYSQKVLECLVTDILKEMPKENLVNLQNKFQEEFEDADDNIHPIAEIVFKVISNHGSTRHILRDVVKVGNWYEIASFPYIENRHELENTLFSSFSKGERGDLLDDMFEVMPNWIIFNDNVERNFVFHIKNKDRQVKIVCHWKTKKVICIQRMVNKDAVEKNYAVSADNVNDDIDAVISWLTFS